MSLGHASKPRSTRITFHYIIEITAITKKIMAPNGQRKDHTDAYKIFLQDIPINPVQGFGPKNRPFWPNAPNQTNSQNSNCNGNNARDRNNQTRVTITQCSICRYRRGHYFIKTKNKKLSKMHSATFSEASKSC